MRCSVKNVDLEPNPKADPNLCNVELVLTDRTFHCNRQKGHEGNHIEEHATQRYCMAWQGDAR